MEENNLGAKLLEVLLLSEWNIIHCPGHTPIHLPGLKFTIENMHSKLLQH